MVKNALLDSHEKALKEEVESNTKLEGIKHEDTKRAFQAEKLKGNKDVVPC